MMRELDLVVLNVDLPEHRLCAGDIGTVVLRHPHHGYEVEFATLEGSTIAVVTPRSSQVRTIRRGEIAHARRVAA